MGQQVVTELVIDANTSGADQFSDSMGKAGVSAQQTILAVAGVGLAVAGAITGLKAFYDQIGTLNKQLVDITENARNAGMSAREFQETLFAARASGLSEKDFVAGLDKIGANLTAASRGVTEFGQLFEKNGLSIRQSNGDLKTTQQILGDISVLMRNAPTPQIEQGIARIVGVSKEWAPYLRKSADEIDNLKRTAGDLGIIINDDVLAKAKEFDKEWKIAIAAWDLQFKASLAEIMPLLIKLAQAAGWIIDKVGAVSSFFSKSLTAPEDMTSSQLKEQLSSAEALRAKMVDLNIESSEWLKFKYSSAKGVLFGDSEADLATADKAIGRWKELLDARLKYESGGPKRVYIARGGTQLPETGGAGNDALDRAIASLSKHIEVQKADEKAVGLGAAALATYRAEAALTAATQANGGKITEEQAAKFRLLIAAAGDAAAALAKAKVASEIQFGSRTAFLSQEDVQIASQLRSIYGNDVPAALSSSYAAAIRLNSAFREISSAIESNLVSGLTDIATGAKTVQQGFHDMGLAIVKALEQALIKMLIVEPIMRSMQSIFGGFGGGSLPLPGASNFIGPVASAHGNVFDAGNVIPFARGGVVGAPTMAPMALFGEAGPEAIVPLKRGPDGNLGIAGMGGSGGGVSFGDINISVPEGTPTGDAESIAASVKRSLEQIVDERLSYHTQPRGMLNRAA